ncbi:fucose permease [Halobacteroides halobius DSM 5150]|uniref:Fucose permease n=1 Tax=Halobacteroides halobius (strain ATCC 35273 / DSM 5150 / MD-1) TaxID=748449 RepID=L0K8A2_HALHC|nr:MFS transporter [Halobacteroides halobius]AGB40328.1 fucose permease [Halobacteroides halobius DSM 5150]
MNQNLNHRLLVILAFMVILVFGIFTNLRGQVNPLIQQDYKIDYSQLGLVLGFFSGGSILATFFGGTLIQKYNLKVIFWSGLLIQSCGLIFIGFIDSYYLLLIVMVIMGVGLGTLNVSGNTLASHVFTKNKGRMMNLFHLFFGIGGMIAPQYANQVFKLGFSWEATYFLGVVLVIILFLFSWFCDFPQEDKEVSSKEITITELLSDSKVIIFVIMFLFHVGAEIGLSSWLGVYLDDVQNRTQTEISFYLSLFFGLFTLGRFLASVIVEKIGYLRLVLISSVSAAVTILLGLLGPDSFAFFFSLTGLFLSVNFPTIQATMFEVFEDNTSSVVGLTLTAGGFGNIIFANWVVGLINDLVGVSMGLGVFVIYLAILVSATFYLRRNYILKKECSEE